MAGRVSSQSRNRSASKPATAVAMATGGPTRTCFFGQICLFNHFWHGATLSIFKVIRKIVLATKILLSYNKPIWLLLAPKVRMLMHDEMIDQLIEDVIEREGDYSNHPADRGGPTRWGITEAVARRQGYMGDMRRLPQSDAAAIYRRLYWIAPRFDEVAKRTPKLAGELFDTGINMGTGAATGFLQRALNAPCRPGRSSKRQ